MFKSAVWWENLRRFIYNIIIIISIIVVEIILDLVL